MPKNEKSKKKLKRLIIFALLTILGIFSFAFGAKIADLKSKTVATGDAIYENTLEGTKALENFNTEKAKNIFTFVNTEIINLKKELNGLGLSKISSIGKIISPLAEKFPAALNDFASLSTHILSLSEKIDVLAKDAFHLAFNKEGEKIIKLLKGVRENLKAIIALSASLKSYATALQIKLPENYLATNVKLYRGEALLNSLLSLMESNKPLHLAVLFQNPSEIRPAGGFIGSYADVMIENGSITNIDVRDIYDPDGWIEEKITPPLPLQTITTTWEARDANWFFDFPTSAEKVLAMLNRSKMYSEKNIAFEGALAINVHLIEDFLETLGEIPLPEYHLVINKENFLEVVQKEVESGEDKNKGEPKKILKILTPIIFERLAATNDADKKKIVEILKTRIKSKDILAYTRDRVLEAYLQNEGIGGEIYMIDNPPLNDYLAIVHANIAGGKTDALINESITLESSIDLRGKIINRLSLEREHSGLNKKEWWYKADNKDYFQILVSNGARLLNISGHDKKIEKFPQKIGGVIEDSDVKAIENSFEWLPEFKISKLNQFGKTTFANYFTTKAGGKKTLSLEYENIAPVAVADGANYRFVYERQSGVKPIFRYSVEAPPGYIWSENNKTKYVYESSNPDSRITLDLTLKKLE